MVDPKSKPSSDSVVLLENRQARLTRKGGKRNVARNVVFLGLPRFDVIATLPEYTSIAKWNSFVKYGLKDY